MNPHEPIYDVNEWRRLGKGRVVEFFATDDEVQTWLIEGLPNEYHPYTLVGVDLVKVGRTYIENGFEFEVRELKKAMYKTDAVRSHFWIRSKVITPELDFLKQTRITWVLSYTGFVNLQHGAYIKNMGRPASSIGIVDKVINDATGEVRHHKEYLRIFNSLKRLIKKSLCYSSIHTFKNGSRREDTTLQLMTEKAVQAYEHGLIFTNEPGRKLR